MTAMGALDDMISIDSVIEERDERLSALAGKIRASGFIKGQRLSGVDFRCAAIVRHRGRRSSPDPQDRLAARGDR